MSSKNVPTGQLSGGVHIPTPKVIDLKASDLVATFSSLGQENVARAAGKNWFVNSIREEMIHRGFVPDAGPLPSAEEGASSLLDGNGRLTVLAQLAKEMPELWGKVRVKVAIYPTLTDDQRQEILNRASRSTAPFTEADYYKQSMLRWIARPDESYVEHLAGMGLERALQFFTAAPETAIIRDKDGIRLKPGVKDDDLWGKSKGGQKQGPVQVGKELSMAHPRARQAFFDGFGPDKGHSISYRELIDTVKHWKSDKRRRPDLANPPADFAVLATELPDSELVTGVLGNRIAHGKDIQGGREAGKGRMNAKELEQLGGVTLNFSKSAPILLNVTERVAGYVGGDIILRVERMFKAIELAMSVDVDASSAIGVLKAAQASYATEVKAIHNAAAAEAEANRQKILAAEGSSSSKK